MWHWLHRRHLDRLAGLAARRKASFEARRGDAAWQQLLQAGQANARRLQGRRDILNDREVRLAIAFNRRHLTVEDVQRLQVLLGLDHDGMVSAPTVQRVAQVQQDAGLDIDGRLGPQTRQVLGYPDGNLPAGTEGQPGLRPAQA